MTLANGGSCTGGESEGSLIKFDEVLLIVFKWRDEATPLRVTARFLGSGLDIICSISEVTPESWLTLLLTDGVSKAFVQISSDFNFDYREPTGVSRSDKTAQGIVHGPTLMGIADTDKEVSFSEIENA